MSGAIPRRRGLLPGFANSADLGGIPLRTGEVVPARRIIRSDTPSYLSVQDREEAIGVGFTAVLDLRSEEEREQVPHPLAALPGYRVLPLIDPVAEARIDIGDFATLGDIYASSLSRNAGHIAAIFTALADAAEGPAMVSCRAGRDRTGMVIALLLDLAGAERDEIVRDYSLREVGVDSGPTGNDLGRTEGTPIIRMLDHLEAEHGGAEGYLRRLGLDDAAITAIRRRLLP